MTIYETIKAAVPVRQAAEHYGLRVNRNGMACCPFHNDRHPSLKLNEDYFYCFGCGAKGDVIDFVAKLFDLSNFEAAQRLAEDFGISTEPGQAVAAPHKTKRPHIRQFREDEMLCFRVLTDYLHLLEDWKVRYAPRTPEDKLDDRFVEACQMLDHMEYLADILTVGTLEERGAVVDGMMKEGKIAFLQDYVARKEKEELLSAYKHTLARMGEEFGSCAFCNKATLSPGETTKVRFILSWFFPNHIGKFGNKLGHQYENHFSNAAEVNRYLSQNRRNVGDKAAAFADTLYRTSRPSVYPDSWSGQLSTIIKDSWYLKDGKFGLWEGFSSCGFHTTDITYQASFGLLALFPELQLGQMEMGAKFQREDGRVHHFFKPDLDHVDNGFDRVDMNNQFVLMILRDYLYTGDRGYLERMWIPVQKAMDSIALLDTDGDGLPDHDTTRNTYDAWNFCGTPTYISVLWLSALKAAIQIARILGDGARAAGWQTTLDTGLISLEKKLWNGQYYDLWHMDGENGPVIDGSLMTDQISGEWFLRVAGIGGNLSDQRVSELLRSPLRPGQRHLPRGSLCQPEHLRQRPGFHHLDGHRIHHRLPGPLGRTGGHLPHHRPEYPR